MSKAPFVVQPHLTAITLAYRNQNLVADRVLPRVPVESELFKWSKYDKGDGFTVPDTRVGRKSQPNKIDWHATEQNDSTNDYGLDDEIPAKDVKAAMSVKATQGVMPIDPIARSTELLTELINLDREKRVADLVFNANSYASSNKATLSGGSRWDDYANSNPVSAILDAMDSMIVRPNKLVLGRAVWTKLRQHPKVVNAFFGVVANAGTVMPQYLAELLEIEEVIIGEGFINTAKKGQTPTLTRVWGKSAALIYQPAVISSPQGQLCYGFTAQYGSRIAGTIDNDPDIGLLGGTRVRVGEMVKEVIAANDTGYLFQTAIS